MSQSRYQSFQQESYLAGDNAAYLESVSNDGVSVADKCRCIQIGSKIAHGIYAAHDTALDPWLEAYRRYGHLQAASNRYKFNDPRWSFDVQSLLDPKSYQLDIQSDYQGVPLLDIKSRMEKLYTGTVGYEYMHLSMPGERQFIQELVESDDTISPQELWRGWIDCYQSEQFERYLSIQFPSQKVFSLSGLDSAIALINAILARFAQSGGQDVVMGMAHRGRLNALVNVMGVQISDVVDWFQGAGGHDKTSGDVKYHYGHSSDRSFDGNQLHLTLAYNPSHLEAVNSVVMGAVRARLDKSKAPLSQIMPLLIHGDGSVIGQGVVQECLNMAYVPAYHVGGTVHIVMNNQVGFTTVNDDARSSRYPSDIFKMIEAPVIHVDAYDLKAVLKAAHQAIAYRQQFHKDICIVINGFRKHGHNEADEPRITQPKLYNDISKHGSILQTIDTMIIKEFGDEKVAAEKMLINDAIQNKMRLVDVVQTSGSPRALSWSRFAENDMRLGYERVDEKKRLQDIAQNMVDLVSDEQLQKIHPQVQKLHRKRIEMARGDVAFDWGMAEILAYNVILSKDIPVRIVGQDAIRSTFSHRHAAYFTSDEARISLLKQGGRCAHVYNSTLSEYAACGFEYGYSTSYPEGLVVWEAQFGDFINGAQIIIDQFITSAWQKWRRMSGLVLLLPHGFEGQGPEHSSARLERILQLCANDNIQVCVPSTPAQMYHLLLRQTLRQSRHPLFVFTPKSLLRHPQATSSYDDLITGSYQSVIDDASCVDKGCVTHLVLCSGKIYYELKDHIESKHVAICRLEQLYPFPYDELKQLIQDYPHAKSFIWIQEEPHNQGAWLIKRHSFEECLREGMVLRCIARPSLCAPACGYHKRHLHEQEDLINQLQQLIKENV